MNLIRHVLAGLLGVAIAATIVGTVLTQTLFNAAYLTRSARDSNAYPMAAAALPGLLGEYVTLSPSNQALFGEFLSAEFVRGQWERLLPQLEAKYHGSDVTPSLDLSDVTAAAQALNVPLPAPLAATLRAPVNVSAGPLDPVLTQAVTLSGYIRFAGPLAALLLVALLLVVGGGHRLMSLARGALVAAGLVLVSAGLVRVAAPLAASTALTSRAKPLGAAVSTWLKAAVAWPVRELTIASLVLAGVALALALAHVVVRTTGRYHHPSRP